MDSEHKSFEIHLFDVLAEGKECVPASKILQVSFLTLQLIYRTLLWIIREYYCLIV